MEDEIDEFVNFDDKIRQTPTFLQQTTNLDEALSMLREYLSNVSDVDDIFQDSMMTCLELSSQITNLAKDKGALA